MSDDSVVFEVKEKYAEDLEELVQCPVCFERPVGPVKMCREGHHICKTCRDQLQECPICKSGFIGARNFAVETLCSKLKDIFSALLDPQQTASKKSINNLTSSCRIGLCQARLPIDRMLRHLYHTHSDKLIEMDYKGTCYQVDLTLKYDVDKMYCHALDADECGLPGGLFFFRLYVNDQGHIFMDFEVAESYTEVNDVFWYTISLHAPHCRKTAAVTYKGTCSFTENKSASHKFVKKIVATSLKLSICLETVC